MTNGKLFFGIDDRIFNDPIYEENEIVEDEISEHDHPRVKDE